MLQSTEPLARELAKEAKGLRQKIGARRLRKGNQAPPSGPAFAAGDGSTAANDVRSGPVVQAETERLSTGDPGLEGEVSLIWLAGANTSTVPLPEASARDLALEHIALALAEGSGSEQRTYVSRLLGQLCLEPEAIRYRQDVIADLLRYPQLAAGLEELLPLFENLGAESMPSRQATDLFQITWWLGALESYVECIRRTADLFKEVAGGLASDGLRRLADRVVAAEKEPAFQSLVRELPELLARVRGVVSITVGINLDPDLKPEAATLLAVNDQKFGEAPLLKMLLDSAGEYEGLMPLHTVPLLRGRDHERLNPMLIPLFRDLSEVMARVTKPVARAIRRFVHLEYRFLARLQPELAFYVGAVKLVKRIEAGGLAMCRPELAPLEERVCEVRDGYNLNLALHLLDRGSEGGLDQVIIRNDVALNAAGRIAVLTGPNRGGKTTYIQGIGLIQVLAQVGLYVPGSAARVSLADQVFTHFPVEEEITQGRGRFGDEAGRLGDIFQVATRFSLVLLNESLSSTYAGESFYLARDVLRIWRLVGARVIYATHMHELANQVDRLNAATPGDSPIVSLVSSRIEWESTAGDASEPALARSYTVVKSPPMGRSYARELAMLYGISFEQLVSLLREREVLDDGWADIDGDAFDAGEDGVDQEAI